MNVDSLVAMGKAERSRGERALVDLVDVVDRMRGGLVRRLDEMDLDAMRRRGTQMAGSVRPDLWRRRRRRRWMGMGAVAALAGVGLMGIAAAGAGFVIYDRERREEARRRLGDVQSRARQRYAELTSGRTRAETDLQQRVDQTVAEAGTPPHGLEVVVEGRTVYLRGAVADPAFVDAAAERVHGVPGVVAVVNLTTSAADDRARAGVQQ